MFNPREPLWLPRGSVRAIIALGLSVAAIAFIAAGVSFPEWFGAQVATVLAFYFAGKNSVNGKE